MVTLRPALAWVVSAVGSRGERVSIPDWGARSMTSPAPTVQRTKDVVTCFLSCSVRAQDRRGTPGAGIAEVNGRASWLTASRARVAEHLQELRRALPLAGVQRCLDSRAQDVVRVLPCPIRHFRLRRARAP